MTTNNPLLSAPGIVGIAGDWHGNKRWAPGVIKWCGQRDVKLLLHVGDFGLWHGHEGKQYLAALEHRCEKSDVQIAFIPGNHENWTMLDSAPRNEHGLVQFREHIFYLPRGTRWQWGDTSWLALGGATSVDKAWRTQDVDWWAREEITPEEAQAAIDDGPADVMLTHDAPLGVPKLEEYLAPNTQGWPMPALHKAYIHRKLLRDVVDGVRPSRLFHGHYHWTYADDLVLNDGHVVHVEGLNMDSTVLRANLAIVDETGKRVEPPELQ